MDRITVPLADVGAGMLAEAGGKAVNLGVMLAAGLPVPDGFCLTTAAYREVATAAGLEWLLAAMESAAAETLRPPGEPGRTPADASTAASLQHLAREARDRLSAAPLPERIERELRRSYARLGEDVPVAVRSSATAEDLPEASFAGQQDTFLNVVGADALLEAVRGCWASLWTGRAAAYREANGIGQRKVRLAVVVQRMVEAAVSGVMFTANPLTGARGQTVVNASPGLGEAVVSGAVNPDQFVVDTAAGRILERTVGDKRVQVRPLPGGGTEQLPLAGGSEPSLTDAQVRQLAELGRAAQELFGAPQDLEWTLSPDGRFALVQTRPITTLYPLPEGDGTTRAYLCASLLQGLTRPLTPMGLCAFETLAAAWKPAGGGSGPPPAFRYLSVGLRLFVDITPVLRSPGGRRLIPRMMKGADARSVGVLEHLMEDPRFAVGRRRVPRSPAGLFRSVPQLVLLPSVLHALFRPAAALRRSRAAEREFDARLRLAEPATAAQRLDFVERMFSREVTESLLRLLPPPAAGYLWLGVARWLLGTLVERGEVQEVLRGLPHNVTTEMDLKLWDAATAIGRDPASAEAIRSAAPEELARAYLEGTLPAEAQRRLAAFLAVYGHRAVAEIDIGVPRWAEDPSHIINVIANYLRLDDSGQAPDRQFARAAAQADAKVADLVLRAGALGPVRSRLVAYGLRRARASAGMREYPKFRLVTALAALRVQLRRVGEELAAAGAVEDAEDVFFLDLAEARVGLRGADLHGIVTGRRRTYAREMRRRHIPRLILSDGTDVEAAIAAAAATTTAGGRVPPGTLVGAPASAGTVTGTARVILDPAGARLEPGEILVAPSTDPGWTPLFLTAGALVMEMGGPVSHGAVVAREYGIPAVVGVPDATLRISTGDTITVDGAAGTIVHSARTAPS